jgi:dTDP-4-dehydrorhamnose 3,5-epimerase
MSDASKWIEGVKVKPLRALPDERGRLFEILRKDEPIFDRFGQAYVTTTYPGVVKAWHYHKLQDDYFCCLRGMIKLVVYDHREGSPTHGRINEFFIGEHNLQLVVVPRLTYHGWKCISTDEAMILNLVTEPYNHQNPDEYRLAPHGNGVIPYDWARRDG